MSIHSRESKSSFSFKFPTTSCTAIIKYEINTLIEKKIVHISFEYF